MNKWRYSGPVLSFDRCIANEWTGETMANSEMKARGNLVYQFKKKHNLAPTAKISLPGKLEEVN